MAGLHQVTSCHMSATVSDGLCVSLSVPFSTNGWHLLPECGQYCAQRCGHMCPCHLNLGRGRFLRLSQAIFSYVWPSLPVTLAFLVWKRSCEPISSPHPCVCHWLVLFSPFLFLMRISFFWHFLETETELSGIQHISWRLYSSSCVLMLTFLLVGKF